MKVSELIAKLADIHEECADCDVLVSVGPMVEINVLDVVLVKGGERGRVRNRALLELGAAEPGTPRL
jgi:hypothetical protein